MVFFAVQGAGASFEVRVEAANKMFFLTLAFLLGSAS